MESWNNILTDWVNLPTAANTQSLWICLHDAELKSIRSDVLEQYAVLEIEAFYLPDGLRVFLRLDGLKSVRVNKYPPPYRSLLSDDMPYPERMQLAEQWVSKWREESMSWDEFEAVLATDPLEIADADLAEGDDGVALRVGGYLNGERYDDLWCSVFFRAMAITAERSDGEDFSLEKLKELGGQWWESFGSRKE